MFLKLCLLFGISVMLHLSYTTKAPYLKHCTKKDLECPSEIVTDIDMTSLAEGIPELGIAAAEPMFFKNITMDQGHFKLLFPSMKVVGVKKCKITKFSKNLFESTLTVSFDCPFEATGDYEFRGTLSIFEVNNEGKYKVETDSIKTTIIAKMEKITGNDKKNYWKLLSYDHTYEPMENLHINLNNFISGSLGSAQSYLGLFNKDWWNSALKVGDPMANAIIDHFFNILKEFYLRVPIDELECFE